MHRRHLRHFNLPTPPRGLTPVLHLSRSPVQPELCRKRSEVARSRRPAAGDDHRRPVRAITARHNVVCQKSSDSPH